MNYSKELKPIGELALNIRGCISALQDYLDANRLDLVIKQIIRAKALQEELNDSGFKYDSNNLVFNDWLRIAKFESKELNDLIKKASNRIKAELSILS